MDGEIAKIPDPLRATAAFDFSLQHEVNREIGIKRRAVAPDEIWNTLAEIGGLSWSRARQS